MKKFFLSITVVISFAGYALRGQLGKPGRDDGQVLAAPNLNLSSQNSNSAAPSSGAANTDSSGSSSTNDQNTNTDSSAPSSNYSPAPTPTPGGQYKDGKYIGTAADAFYGNVQVVATVSGGKLSNVQFLQYPNDRSHSIEINQYALPILRREAIQAQNANVDIVSGATDSSYAFQQSLQSALSQA